MVVMHSVMDVLSVNVLRLLETCPKAFAFRLHFEFSEHYLGLQASHLSLNS